MSKCVGYNKKCENEIDKTYHPFLCRECNKLRIQHINKQMEEIEKRLGEV